MRQWEGVDTGMEHGFDVRAIGNMARRLMQGARAKPPSRFQHWALEQLQTLVSFDAAKWVSGYLQGGEAHPHAIHLYHIPEQAMDDYLRRIRPHDPLLARIKAHPGDTVDLYDTISRQDFIASDLYQTYARGVGIEHAISTLMRDPPLGLFATISLSRADFARPFSTDEKRYKNALFPVMIEARNLNIFLHLHALAQGTDAVAICDHRGILQEAEGSLPELLRREWPDWQGPALPIQPEALLGDQSEAVFIGEHITIRLQPWEQHIEVRVREKGILDSLTPCERRIAQHLAEGMTNKEIANALCISPSTVGNHLHKIYIKLDVPNRQRALAMLKGEL